MALVGILAVPLVAQPQDAELYLRRGASTDNYREALQDLKDNSLLERRGLAGIVDDRPDEDESPAKATSSEDQETTVASSGGLSVKIYFEYNAVELSPEGKAELDKLSAALRSADFGGDRWQIEGHTDAAGSRAYNQDLSERRARSVYEYLVRQRGIERDQLVAVGRGETELYDATNPHSDANRRVRIRYLGR